VRAKQTRTRGRYGSSMSKRSAAAYRSRRVEAGGLPEAATRSADKEETTRSPEEYVRVRAYFLSLNRDQGPSDPVADWLRAEQELSSKGGCE